MLLLYRIPDISCCRGRLHCGISCSGVQTSSIWIVNVNLRELAGHHVWHQASREYFSLLHLLHRRYPWKWIDSHSPWRKVPTDAVGNCVFIAISYRTLLLGLESPAPRIRGRGNLRPRGLLSVHYHAAHPGHTVWMWYCGTRICGFCLSRSFHPFLSGWRATSACYALGEISHHLINQ